MVLWQGLLHSRSCELHNRMPSIRQLYRNDKWKEKIRNNHLLRNNYVITQAVRAPRTFVSGSKTNSSRNLLGKSRPWCYWWYPYSRSNEMGNPRMSSHCMDFGKLIYRNSRFFEITDSPKVSSSRNRLSTEIDVFSKSSIHRNYHFLEIAGSPKLWFSRNRRFAEIIIFSKSSIHWNCHFIGIVDSPKLTISQNFWCTEIVIFSKLNFRSG